MSKPIFKWNLFRAMWTTVALNPGATVASAFECDEMRDFQQKYGDTQRPIKCDYTAEAVKQYVSYASDYTSDRLREFWPIDWYGDPAYPHQHLLHVYQEAVAQKHADPEIAMRIAERIRDLPLTANAPRLYQIDMPNVCYIIINDSYAWRMRLGHVLVPTSRYIDLHDFLPQSVVISSENVKTARDECHIAMYEQIENEIPCIAIGMPDDYDLLHRIESTALHNNYMCMPISPLSAHAHAASLVDLPAECNDAE